MGDTQSLHFWSNFDAFFTTKKDAEVKKIILKEKTQPLGYPEIVKSRRISSPIQMVNRITFWAFLVKIWGRSKVKGSEWKPNMAYARAMNLEYAKILVPPLTHLKPFGHKCFFFNFNPVFQVSSFFAFLSTTPTFLIKNKFDFPMQNLILNRLTPI